MLFLVVVALFKQFHVSYAFSYIWRVFIHSSNNGNGLIQINSSTAATLWYIFYVDSFFLHFQQSSKHLIQLNAFAEIWSERK